jgi:HemK-like putative methylase
VPNLRILDLCTGTGCIPLLLYSLLRPHFSLEVKGVDISSTALELAIANIGHNISKFHLNPRASHDVKFVKADVLSGLDNPGLKGPWDIVISNPPYISHAGFSKDTTRSVRNWEPKLALVPPNAVPSAAEPHPEDVFYPAILAKAQMSMAKVVLIEVADSAQALRAAGMARGMEFWKKVEIWRDWPDMDAEDGLVRDSEDGTIELVGSGHGRSVVCWR